MKPGNYSVTVLNFSKDYFWISDNLNYSLPTDCAW